MIIILTSLLYLKSNCFVIQNGILTCFAYIFPEIDAAIFQTCIACMCGLLWSKHKYRPFFMAFRPLHIVYIYTPCKWPTGLSLSNYTATTSTKNQNLESFSIIIWFFVVNKCEEYAWFFSKSQVFVSRLPIQISKIERNYEWLCNWKNPKNVYVFGWKKAFDLKS